MHGFDAKSSFYIVSKQNNNYKTTITYKEKRVILKDTALE